jgi:hypothetical protein
MALARYGTVSTALALLSDRELAAVVDGAQVLGAGIGGTSARLDVEGVPVFVKRVPLTALELRPEHLRSTENLFGLPAFCQYGVGSPAFGAWRELAAHVMTNDWVLGGQSTAFPLLYHWRVLDGPPTHIADEHADIDGAVAFWGGAQAVRPRLEAVAAATASVVLFLEYVPHNLLDWLDARAPDALPAACAMVERHLTTDVPAMNAAGLFHFDAHFRNILTDGERLLFADLGLATSPRFRLTADEAHFLQRNLTHDRAHTVTQLVNWLVQTLAETTSPAARNAWIRRHVEGGRRLDLPSWATGIIDRHGPVAVVLNDFYWTLHAESRTVPYPTEQVAALI